MLRPSIHLIGLSDMRKRSENEDREKAAAAHAMAGIEVAAKKQYEADKAAEEAAHAARIGTWVSRPFRVIQFFFLPMTRSPPPSPVPWPQEHHPGSGYYYNAAQRWYFDLKSRMYFGGEPPDWTADPPIPAAARYDPPAPAPAAPAAPRPTAARGPQNVVPGSKIVAAHPLAGVGGYQMPSVGRIGGAKGVGMAVGSGGGSGAAEAGKRKRGEGGGGGGGPAKPLSKDEAEFLARREAARQRVEKRTMDTFGLG